MSPLPFAMRVGQGIDVHRFDAERPLYLGGLEIPGTPGLKGHSDADVLLHAIIDAVLGAAAMGDIGTHFPDTDDEWKGIRSTLLAQEVASLVKDQGFHIVNIDSTVMTETPRLKTHIPAIRASIAALFGLDLSQVSVKATTCERMGFIGREEGMKVTAIAMLLQTGGETWA